MGPSIVDDGRRPDCPFCAIVAGTAPASRVHEDEHVLAFLDVLPVTDGHVLVVPKAHAEGLADLDAGTALRVWRLGHRLALALRAADVRCEGVDLFLADGAAASQEVPHVHLHVFPRYDGDGFRLDADWRERERDDLDATAARLARALASVSP